MVVNVRRVKKPGKERVSEMSSSLGLGRSRRGWAEGRLREAGREMGRWRESEVIGAGLEKIFWSELCLKRWRGAFDTF